MKPLTEQIQDFLLNSSMIRKMFEAGIELKKKYGQDNVYDFSLGNPDLPAPHEVRDALAEIAASADQPFSFGYMPNAGYPEARAAVAGKISDEQGVAVKPENIVLTCGAAGAINVLFRSILESGDEVMCPAPYFVEYGFYAGNYRGKLIPIPSLQPDFRLNLDGFAAALSPRTRAVIINSPNNPSGQIYTREELTALAKLLSAKSAENGREIYLVVDEPYRFLNFDNLEITPLFQIYPASVIVSSFSKSLSLPGERIGYAAVNPAFSDAADLAGAMQLTNRILGFLNLPCIGQKILLKCIHAQVDMTIYRRRRDLVANVLDHAGISYFMPRGSFYFFPKSPTPDENVFIRALMDERILVVPGSGFGMPGFFRFAFCVSDKTIEGSADGFKRAVDAVSGNA